MFLKFLKVIWIRRGSRNFSRGGGGESGFSKKMKILSTFLFRLTKLIFWGLPNHDKTQIWRNFLRRRQIFLKKKAKNIFLARATPSKLVYSGADGAFRKLLGSVTKIGYLKIVQRGDPLGRQGGRIPKKGVRAAPPPPPLPPFQVFYFVSCITCSYG